MKQRVIGGLFAGFAWALAASCGGSDEGSPSAVEPTAGVSGPSIPAGGSQAIGGAKAPSSAAGVGSGSGGTGTSTSPVTSTAGSSAAGSSGASASAAGTRAAAGAGALAGTGGSSAGGAGKSGSGAAGGSAAAGGCGSESFAAIYESIFKNTTYNCSGPLCHGRDAMNAMTVGNLSLSSASVAYTQLVKVSSTGAACSGMPRVVPGDAAGSLLVQKLRGATTTCGGVMPVGADEITEADLKRVTDWISAGACDN